MKKRVAEELEEEGRRQDRALRNIAVYRKKNEIHTSRITKMDRLERKLKKKIQKGKPKEGCLEIRA